MLKVYKSQVIKPDDFYKLTTLVLPDLKSRSRTIPTPQSLLPTNVTTTLTSSSCY